MNKIIVEVGSTCTKVDKFDGNNMQKLEGTTIQFKKHYNEDKCLRESDIKELIKSYVCICFSSCRRNRCKIYCTDRHSNGIWNLR